MSLEKETESIVEESLGIDGGMSAEKAKDAKKTTKRLIYCLLRQKWPLVWMLIGSIMNVACSLAAPLLIGKTIDTLYNGIKLSIVQGTKFQVNLQTMGRVLFPLVVVYVVGALFLYLQEYSMAGIAQKLTLFLREKINEKLSKLPLKYYDNHKKGEILSRVTNDLERIADTLQNSLSQLLNSSISLVVALCIMLSISPLLTFISLATIGICAIATLFISRIAQQYYVKNQEAVGALNGHIEEVYTGQLVVRAFNKEQDCIEQTEVLTQELYEASSKAQFFTYFSDPAIRLLSQIGYVVVAVSGVVSVAHGRISLGTIQAFLQYVYYVSEPVTQSAYIINSMQAAIASAERVFEVLDEEEEIPDIENSHELTAPKGNVSFEHVRFGYSEDDILLNDINIDIKAGSKIAIVGPTGAGKTTFVNLLMRFYEIQSGKITIDGVDIKEVRRGNLRGLFGMVLQDTWLFGGTIAENIAYSREIATEQEIVQAAKAARVDHFIRTLPEGYQTVLDDEASNISQGQRQLLTIARAILADPSILILDEATSSVDTRTEKEIQKAMDALMRGRTSFIIAHRLSTIQNADQILVMEKGTIIEQGTHDGLIAKEGFYADLYNSQFSLEAR